MIFKKANEALRTADAALKATSREAKALSEIKRQLDEIAKRIGLLEDAVENGANKELAEKRDYIEGLYNVLNYDISMARKPKGVKVDE